MDTKYFKLVFWFAAALILKCHKNKNPRWIVREITEKLNSINTAEFFNKESEDKDPSYAQFFLEWTRI